MWIQLRKSKIHRATLTDANLNYEGSITIDADLLDAANILRDLGEQAIYFSFDLVILGILGPDASLLAAKVADVGVEHADALEGIEVALNPLAGLGIDDLIGFCSDQLLENSLVLHKCAHLGGKPLVKVVGTEGCKELFAW